ncbi:MAG: host attachment protein [Limibacillus sp.]|jgi:protein required for attachment to host cells
MKPTRTWILVADAGRARIFANNGVGKGLTEVTDGEHENPLPKTRELGSDKPGRSFDSAGEGRHAMAPRADWHEQAKEAFAKELADWLKSAHQANAYDRLVLAAPPKTLGDLRAELDPQVAKLVSAEISKDLTHQTPDQLEEQIGKVLAV